MEVNATLRPLALQSQPVPEAWCLTVSGQPRKSSNTCSSMVSSDHLLVLDPRLYTWCPRRLLVIGFHVETTVPSTSVLFQIATRSPTFMTSPCHCKAPPSSLNPRTCRQDHRHNPIWPVRVCMMPFSLRNAAQTFQQLMDQALCRISSVYQQCPYCQCHPRTTPPEFTDCF